MICVTSCAFYTGDGIDVVFGCVWIHLAGHVTIVQISAPRKGSLIVSPCAPNFFQATLHQHRPQTATSIFPGKWSAIPRIFVPPYNLFFWGKKEKKSGETNPGSLAGTRRNQEIKMEQNPCPAGKKYRETSPGTQAGTRRNQEIMMEKHPFPEKRKKRKVGRQAPEP